jgi:ribonuclease P protein component
VHWGSDQSRGFPCRVEGDTAFMARFSRVEHIRQRADFELAYETGSKVSGRFMTLFARPNAHDHARLGIAATRKIGGAVVRNRAKRVARALFCDHKPATGLDIVVIPRREFLNAAYPSLEREFATLMERAASGGAAASAEPRRSRQSRADSRV